MEDQSNPLHPIIITIDCSEEVRNEAHFNNTLMMELHGTAYNYLDFTDRVLAVWWMEPTTDETEIETARLAAVAGMDRRASKQFPGRADWRDYVKLVLLGPDIDVRLQYVRDLFAALFPNAMFMGVDHEVISPKTLWGEGYHYSDLSLEQSIRHSMIEELEIGVRANNALRRAGIETIGDVADKTERELRATPNLKPRDAEEVIEALRAHNLKPRPRVEVEERFMNVPIDELEFSVRTHNLLLRSEIITVDQLLQWSEEEISNINLAGKKTVEEIVQTLAVHGAQLAPND